MKKAVILISTVMFLFTVVGQALAYFEEDNLILSIYNASDSDVEVGIDLGDISTIDFTATNVTLAAAGSFDLSQFTVEGVSWSDLNAGAFSAVNTSYEYYFGLSSTENPGFNTYGMTSIESNADYVSAAYQSSQTSDGIAVIEAGSLNSYDRRMNSNGTSPAYYGGANDSSSELAEAELDALAAANGYVDIYLYYYSLTDSTTDGQTSSVYPDEDYYAVIRLMADGSVVLNPTVPIPGSFALLASGLIGLVGIRRRKNA